MAHNQTGKVWTYADGEWFEGDKAVLAPRHQAFWLASTVFDGARYMSGRAPDLDRHVERLMNSARILGLAPTLTQTEIETLAWEGIRKFDKDADLYICPIFYAEEGAVVLPDPDSTQFTMVVREAAMPPFEGFSACLSSFRRPARDMAPTEAKASCLYPNVARSVGEAQQKGFDLGVVLDPNGNVAEFSYANLFMVSDGVVATPEINGTFLNGITRQRIIQLLRDDGHQVVERAIDFNEVLAADELFATGNYAKVKPCTKIEDRELQPGPVATRARELYFEFAKTA
ncbi:branched-chain amino acid aminotransferase [Thalassospiraceae bacterium LMO-JJ14]|nr:branched-chain amino acid aminotransferase [Thalassospiraceae bacterium LMO-JJ14]